MPNIVEADRVKLCQYVESMMNDPAFQTDQQNTGVLLKKALFRCGLSRNNEWESVLATGINGLPASQVLWLRESVVPKLSDQTLCLLCMALRMRERVTVDTRVKKMIVFERQIASSNMEFYSGLATEMSVIGQKLDKEVESMLAMLLLCPNADILVSDAFDTTHPELSFDMISNKLTPVFLASQKKIELGNKQGREQALSEMRTLFQHLNVNFDCCGLQQWAQVLANINLQEQHEEADPRWDKKECRRQIELRMIIRAELQEHIAPSKLDSLGLVSHITLNEEATDENVTKKRLRAIWRGLKNDIDLLCKEQPEDSIKLSRLEAEYKKAQTDRIALLKQLDRQRIEDEKKDKAVACELDDIKLEGLETKTKIEKLKKALGQARTVDTALDVYRISTYRIAAAP